MAIDMVTEEVATNLEEVAAATRRINSAGVGIFLLGAAVGAVAGFYFGRRWNREKLRAEAFAESQEEVAKIREAYRAGTTIVEDPKPSIEEVIEERGYTINEDPGASIKKTVPGKKPPAGKKPSKRRTPARPTRPPIPVQEPADQDPLRVLGMWDYEKELSLRRPDRPYVIHQNEFKDSESGYPQVTYTYYATDDTLVGEDEQPLPYPDDVVGQTNLKWGHGADDIDVVFVRNDKLELEMEICRVYQSYEETVLGLSNDVEN